MEINIKRISVSSFQEISPFMKENKSLCVTDFHGVLTRKISDEDSQTPNEEAIEFILKEKKTPFIISSAAARAYLLHTQIIDIFQKVDKRFFAIHQIEESLISHKSYFLKENENLLEIISVKEKNSSQYYKNKAHAILYSDYWKNIQDFSTLIFVDDNSEILEKISQKLPDILKDHKEIQVILAHFISIPSKETSEASELLTQDSNNDVRDERKLSMTLNLTTSPLKVRRKFSQM